MDLHVAFGHRPQPARRRYHGMLKSALLVCLVGLVSPSDTLAQPEEVAPPTEQAPDTTPPAPQSPEPEQPPVAEPPAEQTPAEGVPAEAAPMEQGGEDADAVADEVVADEAAVDTATEDATDVSEVADPEADEAAYTEETPIELTVVGTPLARTAGSAHIIGERQLERFEYDDPHAILLQVPGVYVRQEDGVGLRPNIGIRGVDPERSKKLTLMEDGILFGPSPYSAPAAYFFPLMTRMSQVRVIKGPGAVSFGPQTVGGAIDLISRSIPTHTSGGVDVGVGEYGYGKGHVHFGSSDGQFGFLVEGVHLRNTGFMELPDGANTGSARNEWVVKTSYVLDPTARVRNEFGLKLMYSDEASNESYLGQTDADFRENPYRRYAASALDRMEFQRTSFVASHLLESPAHNMELKTQVYRNAFSRSWNKFNRFGTAHPFEVLRDPDHAGLQGYARVLRGETESSAATRPLIGPNARNHISQGIQSVLSLRPVTGPIAHRFEAGVRLHHDAVARRHTEDAYDLVDDELLVSDGYTATHQLNAASAHAVALHVTDAMTWNRLTITPGARLELIDLRAEDYLTDQAHSRTVTAFLPGIGAFYGLTDTFGLLAGVHRGFSPPTPQIPRENERLPGAESSVSYEAGMRYSAGRARAELIGFYNDYSNITAVCTQAGGCLAEQTDRQFDGGRARIYGIEAHAQHEVPLGAWRLPVSAAYTFTRSAFLSSFQSGNPAWGGVERGDQMPYLPRHQFNTTLGLESRRAGGMLAVTYVAPMREEAGQGALDQALTTDEQLWVDVEAHFRLVGNLVLYANVRNLFNAQNIVARRPFGARVNPPRWVQVGAKVDF